MCYNIAQMDDNNYQQDFFGGESRGKKGKRPGLLNGYSKQRFLPYMKIPIEYTVMIAIGVLVLMIISYAIGVERGKKVSGVVTSSVSEKVAKSEIARKSEPDKIPVEVTEDAVGSKVEAISEVKIPETEEVDPYAGSRGDYVGAPPEEVPEEVMGSVYTIQLATFRSESAANDEVKKLKGKGIDSGSSKSGDWYQVYAQGYQTIGEARAAQKSLSEDYEDCYIRKVN